MKKRTQTHPKNLSREMGSCLPISQLSHRDCPTAPTLPIQPTLPLVLFSPVLRLPSSACPGVALCEAGCLRGYHSIMQNKPNSLKLKNNPTFCCTKSYEDNAPHSAQKNKPKQTQSLRQSSLISHPSSAFCLPLFLRANSWKFVVNPFPPCLSVFVAKPSLLSFRRGTYLLLRRRFCPDPLRGLLLRLRGLCLRRHRRLPSRSYSFHRR